MGDSAAVGDFRRRRRRYIKFLDVDQNTSTSL